MIGAVLAFGTVQLGWLLVFTATGFAAAAFTVLTEPVPGGQVPLPARVLVALSGFSLLQALPLPVAILRWIVPRNMAVWSEAFTQFGEGAPSWATLSLDPGASVVEATKFSLYAAMFTAAAAIGARRGARWMARLMFLSSALVAALTVAHGVLGLKSVYGLYTPTFGISRWHLGPLLNSNNLAGYLCLGGLSGLGLVAERRSEPSRWALGIGVAAVLGSSVLAASRGGVIGLVAGIGTFFVLLRGLRTRGAAQDLADPKIVVGALAIVLVGGVSYAALGTSAEVIRELKDRDIQKLLLAAHTLPLIKDHFFFGIGRGAFESVFLAYSVGPNETVFTHPENFVLQWASEWGVPVTAVAFAVLGWELRPSSVGAARRVTSAGMLSGIVAILTQNLADLGLEVPALALAVTTCFGASWGAARNRVPETEADMRRLPEFIPKTTAVLAAVLLGLTALFGMHPVAGERTALRQELLAADLTSAEDRNRLKQELRGAVGRHPAEPFFSRIGAVVAAAGNESPMPWIHRALERGLQSGHTHYLLGRLLASTGNHVQALLEFRYAAQYDALLAPRVAKAAVVLARDFDEMMSVAPEGKEGAGVLTALAGQFTGDLGLAAAEKLFGAAVARDETRMDALTGHARTLIAMLEHGDEFERCAGAKRPECARMAEREASAIGRLNPASSASDELKARLAMALGGARTAERMLASKCEQFAERESCLRVRVEAAAGTHDRDVLVAAANALQGACRGPSDCLAVTTWIGDTFYASGSPATALAYYEQAARQEPSASRWKRVADLASFLGEHSKAADALGRASRVGPYDPALKARLAEEHERAFRSSLLGQ